MFKREYQNKLYGAGTFYLTHAFYELPFVALFTLIYLLSVAWTTYMRSDSLGVIVKWFILFIAIRFSSSGLGDAGALAFQSIEVFNQAFTVMVIPLFLVSGFVANVKTIAIYMIVYSYLSFFRFGFQGAIEIEFDEDRVEEFRRKCRLLTKCDDPENQNCY